MVNFTPNKIKGRIVLTEEDVKRSAKLFKDITIPAGSIITPLALDTARAMGVRIIIDNDALEESNRTKSIKIEKIAIGADHGGFKLKEIIKDYMHRTGYIFEDFGTHSTAGVDYPDFASKVAKEVAAGNYQRGIIIDSVGYASAIVANKVKSIYAACCFDKFTVKFCREHGNANILTFGAKVVSEEMAKEMVRIFLGTEFAGGRHQKRVDKIIQLENENFK